VTTMKLLHVLAWDAILRDFSRTREYKSNLQIAC